MRVLLSGVEGLDKAGVQSIIMTLVRTLHKEITFDIVLFCNDKRYYDDEFLSYGGRIFRICPTVGKNRFTYHLYEHLFRKRLYNEIRSICRAGNYDVFHCHSFGRRGVILKAAKEEGIPVRIAHSHSCKEYGATSLNYWTSKYVSFLTRKCSTCLLAVSEKSGQIIYGHNENFVKLYNPYDEKLFNPCLYDSHRRNKSPVLIQIGSYCKRKNQLFSLEVLVKLLETYPDSRLRFVGIYYESYFQQLKQQVSKLGLEDKVEFYPGDVADRPKLLSESDYFLFPSFEEGFGIALIEAQSMGVRCFASSVIPIETNVGGCTYLSLDSPEVWASRISEDFQSNKPRQIYDCSRYSTENFVNNIRRIYSGERLL